MKKRILSILLTAALACTVLAGCKKNVGTPEDNAVVETEEGAEEEEESGYLFGYSGIDMDNPYFETLELSIKTTLEEKGHRIMTKNPGADAALQNEQIRELIEADVDAVFLSPVDQEEITPALEELKEAGIPVVNVDTRVIALGALQAIREADRTNILVYGVDGSPAAKAEIAKAGSQFVGTGAQSPINIGKTAVKTAIAILEDKKYKEETLEETFLITSENVELYGTDGWQ